MYIRFNFSCCKTFLVYLLTFTIIYTPTLVFANSNLGGWSMSNPVAQGASTVYNGAKNVIIDGKNYIKTGTAKITPTAAQVGKVLARGGAAYALSVAVEELLGAVDWVLDPANNQIVYTDPQNVNPDTLQKLWVANLSTTRSATPQEACTKAQTYYGGNKAAYQVDGRWVCQTNTASLITMVQVANPNYDPNAETDKKTLPLSTVAARVISNADSADDSKAKPAQVATTTAAADVVAEAEKDDAKARPIVQQLEQTAATKPEDQATADKANEATGTQTQNPAKPGTTDLSLEFPAFCGWAPVVCEAAQVVISFPTLVTDWWNTANKKADDWAKSISEAWASAKDWAKEDTAPVQPEPPLPIEEPDLSIAVTNYINFGTQCPQDRQIPFSFGGHTLNLVISYQPLCTVAQQFKPAVILMAFLAGAFIITNTGRRAEVGD